MPDLYDTLVCVENGKEYYVKYDPMLTEDGDNIIANRRGVGWFLVAQSANAGGGGGSLDRASQAESEAGTDNVKYMTPLRTAQAIAAQASGGGVDVKVVSTDLTLTTLASRTLLNVQNKSKIVKLPDGLENVGKTITIRGNQYCTINPNADGVILSKNYDMQGDAAFRIACEVELGGVDGSLLGMTGKLVWWVNTTTQTESRDYDNDTYYYAGSVVRAAGDIGDGNGVRDHVMVAADMRQGAPPFDAITGILSGNWVYKYSANYIKPA